MQNEPFIYQVLTTIRHWRIVILKRGGMVIIETSIFTRRVLELLDDESYRDLQLVLVEDPLLGKVVRGSGGLRKVRWNVKGRGKRGGVRVIYYWAVSAEQLLMLLIYPKNEQDDLTAAQLKILKRIVEEDYP